MFNGAGNIINEQFNHFLCFLFGAWVNQKKSHLHYLNDKFFLCTNTTTNRIIHNWFSIQSTTIAPFFTHLKLRLKLWNFLQNSQFISKSEKFLRSELVNKLQHTVVSNYKVGLPLVPDHKDVEGLVEDMEYRNFCYNRHRYRHSNRMAEQLYMGSHSGSRME